MTGQKVKTDEIAKNTEILATTIGILAKTIEIRMKVTRKSVFPPRRKTKKFKECPVVASPAHWAAEKIKE